MFSILAPLMHLMLRDVYHHKGKCVFASSHSFSPGTRNKSKEKEKIYQMEFFNNRGIQGHLSKNTPNYFLPLPKTMQPLSWCRKVTLAKCFGELKSGGLSDSIYRRVLKYNVGCLTVPPFSFSRSTQRPASLHCQNITISFYLCFVIYSQEGTCQIDPGHDWEVEREGVKKGRDLLEIKSDFSLVV